VSTLGSEGPYTVFVLTDEAFRILSAEMRKRYMASGPQLRRLLNGHIVPGTIYTGRVGQEANFQTLARGRISIRPEGDLFLVNGAKIVEPDITAKNGVVHYIDAVLLPRSK
jgi:uncharacterized surface protein with fasciclin (FAS1) repeats